MALAVDWSTQVVTVPQADLTLVSGSTYALDVNAFRIDLKAIEASEEGMPQPDIHVHTDETILAGVTYSRFVEIINGYSVTFEDGQYAVNLTGANNNLLDVLNRNQVSVAAQNSAGLITVATGSPDFTQSLAYLNEIIDRLNADEELLPNGTWMIRKRGTQDVIAMKQFTDDGQGHKKLED